MMVEKPDWPDGYWESFGPGKRKTLPVSIPTGVAFKVDDRPQQPMQLQSCGPEGCVATVLLDSDTLKAMQHGKTMAVGALPQGSTQTMAIPVSLKGFKAALSSLE